MKSVFADAGYWIALWIALFHPRDRLHSKALAVSRNIKGFCIITSQAVLTEFLNHFAAFGPQFRQKAVQVVSSLLVSSLQESLDGEVVAQTPEQFESALLLYSQRADKE